MDHLHFIHLRYFRPTLKFQLVSELHLKQGGATVEHRSRIPDDRGCKYLLLAGDIENVGRSHQH
jgi:hypothetical protein